VKRSEFDLYIGRFNAEDPGAFDDYMAPDVRMVNGTLTLDGVGSVKEHYARIWGAMRESLHVARFVSDATTAAVQMHTHFDVRADDDESPFGEIRVGEAFDFYGLIMYRIGGNGKFTDVTVAYNRFMYTALDGVATDLGIPHLAVGLVGASRPGR
jgi:hypothetical protein